MKGNIRESNGKEREMTGFFFFFLPPRLGGGEEDEEH